MGQEYQEDITMLLNSSFAQINSVWQLKDFYARQLDTCRSTTPFLSHLGGSKGG